MKKIIFSLATVATIILLASCTPKLAQQPSDPSDTAWVTYVQKAYPNWKQPENPPPFSPTPTNKLVGAYPHEEGVLRPNGFSDVPETPVADDIFAGTVTTTPVTENIEMDIITPAPIPTPAPIAATVVTPATTSEKVYIVKPGDSIWKIAVSEYGHGKYSDHIIKANPSLSNKDKLKLGAKLVIPVIPGTKTATTKTDVIPATKLVPATPVAPVVKPTTDTAPVVAPVPATVDTQKI